VAALAASGCAAPSRHRGAPGGASRPPARRQPALRRARPRPGRPAGQGPPGHGQVRHQPAGRQGRRLRDHHPHDPRHGLPLPRPRHRRLRRDQAAHPGLPAPRAQLAARRPGMGLHREAGQPAAARRPLRVVRSGLPLQGRDLRARGRRGPVRQAQPQTGARFNFWHPETPTASTAAPTRWSAPSTRASRRRAAPCGPPSPRPDGSARPRRGSPRTAGAAPLPPPRRGAGRSPSGR
jgi:hypothetical protein